MFQCGPLKMKRKRSCRQKTLNPFAGRFQNLSRLVGWTGPKFIYTSSNYALLKLSKLLKVFQLVCVLYVVRVLYPVRSV